MDEHYFDTMGLPILKGRGFRATDSADAPRVAVVNEQLAAALLAGQDPIGKRFRLDDSRGPWVEIVGRREDRASTASSSRRPREFVYLPYRQRPQQSMFLLAESLGDPASLVTPLRDVVRSLDANQPISNVRTMEEFYRMRSVVILDVISGIIAAMGMMGLALAIVGLYGLVAYAASRRTKEIGIRMAIGAGRSDVVRMVLRQGMVLAVAGLGVGLLASAGASRALAAVFPGGPAATAEPISWRSRWSRQPCWRSRCSRRISRRAARPRQSDRSAAAGVETHVSGLRCRGRGIPEARLSVACAPGHDQCNVVVLFVAAELPHLFDNRRDDGRRGHLRMSPDRLDQAMFAEFIAGRVERLSHSVGIQGQACRQGKRRRSAIAHSHCLKSPSTVQVACSFSTVPSCLKSNAGRCPQFP